MNKAEAIELTIGHTVNDVTIVDFQNEHGPRRVTIGSGLNALERAREGGREITNVTDLRDKLVVYSCGSARKKAA